MSFILPLFHLLYQPFRLLQKKGELTSCVSDQVTAAGIHSKQSTYFKQIFLQESSHKCPLGRRLIQGDFRSVENQRRIHRILVLKDWFARKLLYLNNTVTVLDTGTMLWAWVFPSSQCCAKKRQFIHKEQITTCLTERICSRKAQWTDASGHTLQTVILLGLPAENTPALLSASPPTQLYSSILQPPLALVQIFVSQLSLLLLLLSCFSRVQLRATP